MKCQFCNRESVNSARLYFADIDKSLDLQKPVCFICRRKLTQILAPYKAAVLVNNRDKKKKGISWIFKRLKRLFS